jgi:capsid assembly protease
MSNPLPPLRTLHFLTEGYWAIEPSRFYNMLAIVEARCGLGLPLTRTEKDAAISAAQASREPTTYSSPPQIKVLSLYGTICPRMSYLSDVSQEATSLDAFTARYRAEMADPNTGGIIILIDSPGGNVFGVEEAGEVIYSYRDTKPNVGIVTGMCASAALWLSTQFKELVACPSSDIGSIGVLMRHDDVSARAEMEGLKVTFITAPENGYKSEGNPFEPSTPEFEDHCRMRCGEYYQSFLKALSRGRSVKTATIDKDWGRGRMMGAQAAKSLGIVDRIGTVQGEIDRMAQQVAKRGGRGVRAEGESVHLVFESSETVFESQEPSDLPVLANKGDQEGPFVDLSPEAEDEDQSAHDLALAHAHLKLVGA